MLTNTQKYDYYCKTLEIIEQGWTKNSLENEEGHCLVGAMNRAVTGRSAGGWQYTGESNESRELQHDFAALLRVKSPLLIKLNDRVDNHQGTQYHEDGGLAAVEMWNDAPWRRKSKVVRRLRQRISQLEPLARAEEITRLESLVTELRGRITRLEDRVKVLEARVAELEAENRFLRKSKLTYTATQLRNESRAIKDLDDELNAALAELKGYGVNA